MFKDVRPNTRDNHSLDPTPGLGQAASPVLESLANLTITRWDGKQHLPLLVHLAQRGSPHGDPMERYPMTIRTAARAEPVLHIEVFLRSCLVIVSFLICGTLRAALQLLTLKALGVGVVLLLKGALAFSQGLLGLSPFGGFKKLPLSCLARF